jgi:transcriptional regulator with XRE-family HTH domain
MKDNQEAGAAADLSSPLALDIAGKRQFFGKKGLTQEELAALAGISVRQLAYYEGCRRLPRGLDTLLSLSAALGTTVDALISHSLRMERIAEVDERRAELGLDGSTGAIGCRLDDS